MKKIVMLLILAIAGVTAWAKTQGDVVPKDSYWTNGFASYHVSHIDSDIIQLEGGSLHEGGYMVNLKRRGDHLEVLRSAEDFDYTCFGLLGSRVEYRKIGNQEVLLAYSTDANPEPCDVLVRFDGNELAYELRQIERAIAGTYEREGRAFVIGDGKMDGVPYEVAMVYDMPTDIIKLSDGTCRALRQDVDKLMVYAPETGEDPDDWYSMIDAGHFLFSLDRIDALSWLPQEVTTRPALSLFTNNLLQTLAEDLMRDDTEAAAINAALIRAELKNRTEDGGQG